MHTWLALIEDLSSPLLSLQSEEATVSQWGPGLTGQLFHTNHISLLLSGS